MMTMMTILSSQLDWVNLQVPADELRPMNTLVTGQCFNWKPLSDTSWAGVVNGKAYAVQQTASSTLVADLSPAAERQEREALVEAFRAYFQLQVPLAPLYAEWGAACPRMHLIGGALRGVRVIAQDPWECLLSFICSSNNNIARITGMLDRLRAKHGRYLCSLHSLGGALQEVRYTQHDDDQVKPSKRKHTEDDISTSVVLDLYSFPTPSEVCFSTEEVLKELGMGYRGKYILGSARFIAKQPQGEGWLHALRAESRQSAALALQLLPGVGPKVADCVALFSLGHADTLPVDTHVWAIATRDYAPQLAGRSLTPAVYQAVGDAFRTRFPSRAGWAHCLLFAAELPAFQGLLPADMVQDMRAFSVEQKKAKAAVKASKASSSSS